MRDVRIIYHNTFGMSFYWVKEDEVLTDRIQIVFKETGFYLSVAEIRKFSGMISEACTKTNCGNCSKAGKCRRFLLKTPLKQIDLAVSANELDKIKDLVEGTLFQVELNHYLWNVSLN